MVKDGLMGRMGNRFYKIATTCAFGLGAAYGCGDSMEPKPEPNNPPTIELSVSTNLGYSPLEITVQGVCTDPDGDLKDYKVLAGGNILTRKNPTDTTYTLTQDESYTAECEDMKGNRVYAGPREVKVLHDQFAFWSNRPVPEGGYNEDIYSMNLDGSGLERLTTDPGKDLEITYSPDGKEFLFTSHRTGGTAVWRMNVDGSNQRDITSSIVERARQADWCSNGLIVIAYRDLGDSVAGIGIISLDENSFTPIYSEPKTGRIPEWPSWSNDCSEIAFQRYDGALDIWKMNSDGNGLINLTNHSATDQSPAWSPNGNKIAFISDREGSLDIHKMNSDGNNVMRLTSDPGHEVDVSWSPDGSKFIFAHDLVSFLKPQIYMMNFDGSGEWTQLTTEGANRYPTLRLRQQ